MRTPSSPAALRRRCPTLLVSPNHRVWPWWRAATSDSATSQPVPLNWAARPAASSSNGRGSRTWNTSGCGKRTASLPDSLSWLSSRDSRPLRSPWSACSSRHWRLVGNARSSSRSSPDTLPVRERTTRYSSMTINPTRGHPCRTRGDRCPRRHPARPGTPPSGRRRSNDGAGPGRMPSGVDRPPSVGADALQPVPRRCSHRHYPSPEGPEDPGRQSPSPTSASQDLARVKGDWGATTWPPASNSTSADQRWLGPIGGPEHLQLTTDIRQYRVPQYTTVLRGYTMGQWIRRHT